VSGVRAVNGFLLVDKPSGWTSHDVVAKVRNLARLKKVGHAGTLDPMATGLLVLGLGRCTRLLRFVQEAPKEYVATAMLGVATDSLDADGAVLAREPMPVGLDDVSAVLSRFVGSIHQVPPMVSARKVDGRRLYELAREGVEVAREPRPVTIHHLEITDFAPCDYPEMTFCVRCSKGTYVRTLADDIAGALGGRAHLTALRRMANGKLTVDEAHSIDELEARAAEGTLLESLVSPASGLPDLAAVTVEEAAEAAVRNGVSFPVPALGRDLPEEGPVRLLDQSGGLLAVYAVDGGRARAQVVMS
jgi:tRNA pseudouridine55 synthase